MMWVINQSKERIRIYLRNDIESNITNLINESNEIHASISAINRAVGGTPSGNDAKLIGSCQLALQNISIALQNLNVCRERIEQLNTKEWVSDD